MKKGLTELVFIMDKSGSMSGLEKDTIGGYNAMLHKQRKVEGECRLTTVLFNDGYEQLHDRKDIRQAHEITEKEYRVGGSTALLDAIGRTIDTISVTQKYAADHERAENVLFVIITDGEENSSREYSSAKVKAQIEWHKEKEGWEFIFLGANIDAVQTAGRYGIAPERAVDYLADSAGTELNFKVMDQTVTSFRKAGKVEASNFEDIQKDVKSRGGRK
ncbi:vWA domain-containing protein [Jeotgalibacillus aurantiacus]|uniref:vWA domain-containing protein n=1 Tax=Jeotgalibacillus aurantiacus TaxID=2763266 RepID=UPI001D0B81DF|nr:vWA domain-containing protein [Jeotgalibacillus aurantiacus]